MVCIPGDHTVCMSIYIYTHTHTYISKYIYIYIYICICVYKEMNIHRLLHTSFPFNCMHVYMYV